MLYGIYDTCIYIIWDIRVYTLSELTTTACSVKWVRVLELGLRSAGVMLSVAKRAVWTDTGREAFLLPGFRVFSC